MTNRPHVFTPKKNLTNLKIWLSGAIPEKEHWTHPLVDRDILEFVSLFSSIVFQKGGTIAHGSHPVFTPILAMQSKRFANNKKQLQLYVSSLWGDAELKQYKDYCTINIIESHFGSNDSENAELRNKSLTSLRKELARHSHSIVSIGGKRHLGNDFVAGVSEEVLIAKKLGLPCYNIASFGGEAEKVDVNNSFLSKEEARSLEHSDGISFLISNLVSLLARDCLKIKMKVKLRRFIGMIIGSE